MAVRLSSLARKIMKVADRHLIMPGEALPDDDIELLLDAYPTQAEVAFDELYAYNLLEDNAGWLELTEEGFDYIMGHTRSRRT
ncbi:hypothetical protein MQY53_004596 [Salmonella enterica subsp. enterica]|nr:hypothetical protein [Salmonella enterica subsp. enterica]